MSRYAFRLRCPNELAGLDDEFTLLYFCAEVGSSSPDTIELHDILRRRRSLARSPYPALKLAEVRVGGKISIWSRTYAVTGFADESTRAALGGDDDL